MTRVTKGGVTQVEYEYDGDGGRTKKISYVTGGSAMAMSVDQTCLLPGSMVLMGDGSKKRIEDVKEGDYVLSLDEKNMTKVPALVKKTFTHPLAHMEHGVKGAYVVINGKLRVTQNHPIYTQGKYIDAWMLKVGDVILDENLKEIPIKTLETKEDRPVKVVYNLEVDTHQNYFADGILVHNKLAFSSLIEGSAGGATSSALAAAYVTKYVGSLYEENPDRVTDYIYLGDQRVAAITDGAVNYYHADHLGGSNVITNSSGVMKELTEYDPYGKYSRQESYGTAEEKAFRYFTGKEYDTESELYYYGARYYDPGLGRFITADTVVPGVDNPQSFNRYAYCQNNPINRIDPSGHWSWKSFWKSFAGAFVGVVTSALLGPVVGSTVAGMIGGAVGGAITGGLESGGRGALFGALGGGILGGVGGWASGLNNATGNIILGGMLAAGVGLAAATDSWDRLTGGLAGGLSGGIAMKTFLTNTNTSQPGSNVKGSSYEKINAPEYKEDELTMLFNDVKKSMPEKVAIANALTQAAETSFYEPGLVDVTIIDFFTVTSLVNGAGAIAKGVSAIKGFTVNLPLQLRSEAGFALIRNTASKITGFTKHGINQIINRGIKPREILDAVKNPLSVKPGKEDVTRFIGRTVDVRLNSKGEVVTAVRTARPE